MADVLCKDENPSHSAFRGLPRANLPACPMSPVLPIPTVFVGSQGFSLKGAAVNLFPAVRHIWKKLIVRMPQYFRSAGQVISTPPVTDLQITHVTVEHRDWCWYALNEHSEQFLP